MEFSNKIYRGYIVKGDLTGAIGYLKGFPEQAELYGRYIDLFERENYITYEADADLNSVLATYQKYYRDAFYLRMDKQSAADRLRENLASILHMADKPIELDAIEQNQLVELFQDRGLHFMGGRTSGYYGPYVWRDTESETYEVELPEGTQAYTVKMLDGFLSKSWMDYLSFGEFGTGGWTDPDGVINCVRTAYDLDSEGFKVSLLKHEAQHAMDLQADPDMRPEDLEYRAKLVELIYSSERNLLEKFSQESAASDGGNGHAMAAARIVGGFTRKLGLGETEIAQLPAGQVQAVARELFSESRLQ